MDALHGRLGSLMRYKVIYRWKQLWTINTVFPLLISGWPLSIFLNHWMAIIPKKPGKPIHPCILCGQCTIKMAFRSIGTYLYMINCTSIGLQWRRGRVINLYWWCWVKMWAAEGCGRLRNDSGLAERKSEKTKRQLEQRNDMWRGRQQERQQQTDWEGTRWIERQWERKTLCWVGRIKEWRDGVIKQRNPVFTAAVQMAHLPRTTPCLRAIYSNWITITDTTIHAVNSESNGNHRVD